MLPGLANSGSFFSPGFETAVDEAQRAIGAAYVEAIAFPDCVSVVKLSKLKISGHPH